MLFGIRKHFFQKIFSVQYCYNSKNITPPWKLEILLFRHFPKLKIAYFNGINPFNFF